MNVLNVNSTFGLFNGGGTAERTFQMSYFLTKKNINCTVLTLDIGLDDERVNAAHPVKVVALPVIFARYHLPFLSFFKIFKIVKDMDIVHLMGHWSILNAIVYLAVRHYKKPYVVCPAGALPIFGRSKLLKRIYNNIIGKRIIKNAFGWIAVTKSELPHFAEYGVKASKVTIIPNGISETDFPNISLDSFKRKYSLENRKFILFLGRLNYIKGPDLLIEAFSAVHRDVPEFDLVFVGPDEGMLNDLIIFAKNSGISSRVHFLGFLEGVEKVAAYRSASLLVVPSRQEAMSIVALEAGVCETPVLLTDQCGFEQIKNVNFRLEVPANVEGLSSGLGYVLKDPTGLVSIGVELKKYVDGNYLWNSVVNRYIKMYEEILC